MTETTTPEQTMQTLQAEATDSRTRVIFVAHTTRLIGEPRVPAMTPPKNYGEEAAARWLEKERQKFLEEAANQPYTGTFDEVCFVDPKQDGQSTRFTAEGCEPFGDDTPVALKIRQVFHERYGHAWPHKLGNFHPDVYLVGFNIRRFVKMLGLECAIRDRNVDRQVLPFSVWYASSAYLDLAEAVMPRDFKIDWPMVLDAFGIDMGQWTGPGQDARADLHLATTLGYRLGFYQVE